MKLIAAAILALSMLASPALAQNTVTAWSNSHFDVDGSSPGDDPGCIMTATYAIPGRADVDFNLLWDGEQAIFALTSTGWSAEKGQTYPDFYYYFPKSESLYSGGLTGGYVYEYIHKGFMTAFDPEFLDKIAAEPSLVVSRIPEDGELTVVADLNLTGSAPAIAALKRCTDYVIEREAARIRRESRNDYIARDPFKS